ncbi:MAG: proprotein convertase P-domain-containing protein [Gemmatales bacterium]
MKRLLTLAALFLSTTLSLAQTFTGGSITIVDNAPANPYPAVINVAGITETVTQVTVTITGLTHSFTDDIGAVLVGPLGQTVLLFDGPGDGGVTNLTWTFTDSASGALPNGGTLVSGNFQPGQDEYGDTFDSPAPVGPFGNSLSVYNGINPNGNWQLFVQDFAPVDSGTIQEWSLTFSVAAVPEPSTIILGTGLALAGVYTYRRYKYRNSPDILLTRRFLRTAK